VAYTFPYVFSENGCVALRHGSLFHTNSIASAIGEATLKRLINFALHYIADLDIPVKRGTFIEYRKGMLNISPIGRNCSQEERDAFSLYDKEQGIRKQFVERLKAEFMDSGLQFSIGGQISIDVFPVGWDKTYCLQFLDDFEVVHFFGDRTVEGGNDYEIYSSARTVGHSVTSPEETVQQVTELLSQLGL
jgi:phosphomannomutase